MMTMMMPTTSTMFVVVVEDNDDEVSHFNVEVAVLFHFKKSQNFSEGFVLECWMFATNNDSETGFDYGGMMPKAELPVHFNIGVSPK